MQAFEFHFNPKVKEDLIFDSFCFEPENIYEKRMGGLYMAGFLKNTLPQNTHFLDRLAKVIKERFYRSALLTPEKSLKESLKEANEFLESITKRGDVSWLGNLSFITVSLKNFYFNSAKVGNIKVFLLRGGQIIDIDGKLQNQEIEPYPLKVFGNIVSGKLAERDVLLILTKDVATLFKSQNLLEKIAELIPFSEKALLDILKSKKDELQKVFGVCLVIFLTNQSFASKKENLFPAFGLKEFSLKETFSSVFNSAIKQTYREKTVRNFRLPKPSNIFHSFRNRLSLLSIKKQQSKKIKETKIPIKSRLKPPQRKISVSNPLKNIEKIKTAAKRFTPVLALIIFLILGFFIFQMQNEKQLKIYEGNLNQIQEKLNQAENLLLLSDTNPQASEKANSLLKECWNEISLIVKEIPNPPGYLNNQISSLKDKILKDLSQTNKLTIIENPELILEFSPNEFIPQKIITTNDKIYLFSPYSPKIVELNPVTKQKAFYSSPFGEKGISEATILHDYVLFFSKPDKLVKFEDGSFGNVINVTLPYPDANLAELSSFNSNLYFLDKNSGKIIKYTFQNGWGSPQIWLSSSKTVDANSMVVDGNAWVLNKDNTVSRYYSGKLQDTITIDIFPSIKLFSKIFTPYPLYPLYISEPIQSRIIILNKNGNIIQQIQSEKFDNILDFTVSEDGKIIYILNGLKIYKVKL